MNCLIFANGDYGDLEAYSEQVLEADRIICADGGAAYAVSLGKTPDLLLGDMDSLDANLLENLRARGVDIRLYPREKDYTDMQLALEAACEWGASRITILGGMGDRLDHTMSSIFSCLQLAREGREISFYRPGCRAFLVNATATIGGNPGDIVSLLALDPEVCGVTLEGFKYPLQEACLRMDKPYAVSNELIGEKGVIRARQGILLVIHSSRTDG